jgi:hypothetical protein
MARQLCNLEELRLNKLEKEIQKDVLVGKTAFCAGAL